MCNVRLSKIETANKWEFIARNRSEFKNEEEKTHLTYTALNPLTGSAV